MQICTMLSRSWKASFCITRSVMSQCCYVPCSLRHGRHLSVSQGLLCHNADMYHALYIMEGILLYHTVFYVTMLICTMLFRSPEASFFITRSVVSQCRYVPCFLGHQRHPSVSHSLLCHLRYMHKVLCVSNGIPTLTLTLTIQHRRLWDISDHVTLGAWCTKRMFLSQTHTHTHTKHVRKELSTVTYQVCLKML